jgi:hypothetical protein
LKQDFFKIAGKDLSQMSFLDRLNLKGKLRDQVSVAFSAEEQALFEACDATQTWSDVLEVCGRIIDYIESDKNVNPQIPQPQDSQDDMPSPSCDEQSNEEGDDDTQNLSHSSPADEDSQSSESDKASEESKSEKSESSESSESSENSDEADDGTEADSTTEDSQDDSKDQNQVTQPQDDKSEISGAGKSVKSQTQAKESKEADYSCSTQQSFDNELNKLHEGNDYSSINTPIPSDFAKCVNDLKKVRAERQKRLSRYNDAMTDSILNERWNEFKKSSKSSVASFVKEFERKKSAFEYSRATLATTGQINVNKLHAYRYDDQIFKSVSRLAQSKSHGMAFFLDCSQSMDGVISDVVKQIIVISIIICSLF